MKTKPFLPAIILTALTCVLSVDGSVIFSDDFTDASATNGAWERSSLSLTTTVANGSLSLVNTHATNTHEFSRSLGSAQTSEFTISYIQKSASGEPRYAGLMFCRESFGNGYFVALEGNYLRVFRVIDGSAESIFTRQSRDALQGDNKITVSKRGAEFHVFLNDVFQGSFTDSQYDSGDVSFYLMPSGTATFGEISMTNEFRPGEFSNMFSDDFEGGQNPLWINPPPHQGSLVVAENGVLRLVSQEGSDAQTRVDFPMTDFDAQVDVRYVSHVSAYPNSAPYGIVLTMLVPASNNQFLIHNVYFLIDNWGYFMVGDTRAGGDYNESDNPHDAIKFGTTNEFNTLRVVRSAGASAYEFYANGTKLPVDFPVVTDITIAGIGLFVGSNTTAEFDNFTVTRSGDIPSSIRQPRQFTRSQRRVNADRSQLNNSFYDLRGRRVYSADPTSRNHNTRRIAAGMYVNEERKDVMLRRR